MPEYGELGVCRRDALEGSSTVRAVRRSRADSAVELSEGDLRSVRMVLGVTQTRGDARVNISAV